MGIDEIDRLRDSLLDARDEVIRLRAENAALKELADDLFLTLPGQAGYGDISREQRTRADYAALRGEVKK